MPLLTVNTPLLGVVIGTFVEATEEYPVSNLFVEVLIKALLIFT